MNNAPIIRKFNANDISQIIEIWNECGLTRPWNDPHKDIKRRTDINYDLFVVMELGDEIIGVIMAGYDGHRGNVNYLGIKPKYQRNRYAAQLMDYVERELIKIGCPKINLLVRASNHNVRQFYENIGYAQEDVICFGKRLIKDD